MLSKRHKLSTDQTGLASILVTMIIMIIISLIVIGFARLSRREQRQALDDQLSTQAFYAAESGVNDAVKYINTNPLTQDYTTDCNAFINVLKTKYTNPTINQLNGNNVQYTCLLVNRSPANLQYPTLTTATSIMVPITPQGGTPISSLTIGWEDPNRTINNTFCPTSGQFTPGGSWPCKTGMIRADILPVGGGSRSTLSNATMTAFLYPTTGGGGSLAYAAPGAPPGNTASIANGNCNTGNTPYCSVTITFSSPMTQGYLRLKSIYLATSVTITANGGSTPLIGAQVTVDATGKANDVLRRVQVRVPLSTLGPFPEFAVQSGDSICKQLQIDQSSFAVNYVPGPSSPDPCNPFN